MKPYAISRYPTFSHTIQGQNSATCSHPSIGYNLGMAYTTRKAARAILITPQSEVLLIRMAFPWREVHLWILPGGGIEQGESAKDAVKREVYEETGATNIKFEGEAWHRESFVEAKNTHLDQRYFLAFTEQFDPKPTDLSEQESDWIREYRWWSVEELESESIVVEPTKIAQEIKALIQHGVPANPIEIDE